MYNEKLDIELVSRNQAYFGKYSYVYSFLLPELCVIRSKSHGEIDRLIEQRRSWQQLNINFGGSWHGTKKEVSKQHTKNLHNLLDILNGYEDYKLTISMDVGYFYTNSLKQIDLLNSLDYTTSISCKKVKTDIPTDSILIKNSEYKYRTYLKTQKISEHEKQMLINFFQNQKVRLGPSLHQFITRYANSTYIADNYFIDHNDLSCLTLLGLTSSVKIRKTLSIVNHKYTHGKDTRKSTSSQA